MESLLQEEIKEFAVLPNFYKDYQCEIEIIDVYAPSLFYARLLDNARFVELINYIPRSSLKQIGRYNVEDLVIYAEVNYPGILKRGRIKKVSLNRKRNATYEIFAIDFGLLETNIKERDIWHCEIDVEPLAYACQLNKCQPMDLKHGDWDFFAKKKMKDLCEDKFPFMMTFVSHFNNKLVVDLCKDGHDIAEFMASMGWVRRCEDFYF